MMHTSACYLYGGPYRTSSTHRSTCADMSCDKAMPCNVTVLAGPSSRMPWNAQSESAIIRNGTSFWLWVNRYMEKLAKHVLLISLHWAHEQSLFLSWWSGTPFTWARLQQICCTCTASYGKLVNQPTLFSGFFVSSLIAGTWRGKVDKALVSVSE